MSANDAMNDEDAWAVVEGILEECWPGDWTEATGPSFRIMLAGYSPSQVIDALRTIARRQARREPGKPRWRPSISDILSTLEGDATAITWTSVEDWLLGDQGVLRAPWTREQLVEAAATASPVLASFMGLVNLERLRSTNYDDERWGEKNRGDLREEWERFVDAMGERTARGMALPSGETVRGTLVGGGSGMKLLRAAGVTPHLEAGDRRDG